MHMNLSLKLPHCTASTQQWYQLIEVECIVGFIVYRNVFGKCCAAEIVWEVRQCAVFSCYESWDGHSYGLWWEMSVHAVSKPRAVSHSCCCSRKGLVTGFTKPSFSCSKTFLWNAARWTARWAGETSGWWMSRGMRERPGHCLLWHLTRAFNIWWRYEL